MEKNLFVVKGDFCFSMSAAELAVRENSYLVCEDGTVKGIFDVLPEAYKGSELYDYTGKLIIPGMTDLHLHASQYANRGIQMDLELLEWLNKYTFPEEARFADISYAKQAYVMFAEDLHKSFTTRACIFATLHTPATKFLMEVINELGIKAYIGRVNMDRNGPEFLQEKSYAEAIADTAKWIEETADAYKNVRPIITPRFIPSCTDELMKGLSKLQEKTGIPAQSHLSENRSEIGWVHELCPESSSYSDAYDMFEMLGQHGKTIMAHCVYLSDEEIDRMAELGTYIAHCPQSNMNIASGIAPVRKFIDRGVKLGLGSDIAGGASISMFRAITDTMQASKLRWCNVDDKLAPIKLEEAFYMATKGGGSFFGKAGSFEEGYEFDALVIDETRLPHPRQFSVKQRLERCMYIAEAQHLVAKFVAGNKIL